MKKFIAVLLVLVLCVSLCACGEKTLSGKYVHRDEYGGVDSTIVFEKNGTCTYIEGSWTFNGTYQESSSLGWKIVFDTFLGDMVIFGEESGKDLIIDGDLYTKE